MIGIITARPKYSAQITTTPVTSDVSARTPGASGGRTLAGGRRGPDGGGMKSFSRERRAVEESVQPIK